MTPIAQWLKRQQQIVWLVRAVRAIWWLGPWQEFFVRRYQRRNSNPALVRQTTSLFAEFDLEKALTNLKLAGFASGLKLPEAEINQIVSFCGQQDACVNPHANCQTVNNIACDPKLLEVVTGYFGAEPVLFSSSLYWTWPPKTEEQYQQLLASKSKFHYDVGDFKTLSVFIYLTDVDENCGPHVVIQGSHRHKPLCRLLSRYLNDREAYAKFGDQIHTITGQRGSGFFEDLTCYHKHSAGRKERLVLTICYLLQRTPAA